MFALKLKSHLLRLYYQGNRDRKYPSTYFRQHAKQTRDQAQKEQAMKSNNRITKGAA